MKQQRNNSIGKLFIVPGPIGNLEDITYRAVKTLNDVDFILAEDTRTSSKLLKHLGISKPSYSYHIYNEHKTVARLLEQFNAGAIAALISDAGTPGIADPGFLLIRECKKEGIDIECLPGPTALIPALVNSGFPSDRFIFEGFLPHKKGRHTKFLELAEESRTMIFYESPHRLLKTLTQMAEYFGSQRSISISRELTKIHEETITSNLLDLIKHFENNKPKGEIVIVVKGKEKKHKNQDS